MQQTYSVDHANAYPGRLADSRENVVWPAKFVPQMADAPLPFGSLVTFVDPTAYEVPSNDPAVSEGVGAYGSGVVDGPGSRGLIGIAVHDAAREGSEGVAAGEIVNVLTRGCVFVNVIADVYPGQAAAWNSSGGRPDQFVPVGTDPGPVGYFEAVTGAVFRSHAKAGGAALLELI